MVTNQTIVEDLLGYFGDAVYGFEEPFGLLTFTTAREQLLPLVKYLVDHPTLRVNFLTDICGIHFPDAGDKEFGVIYHFHSLSNNVRLRIKVFVPENDIIVPSLVDIFPTANWMERETFDFYGIKFAGHPNLTRILNMEDMDYHPMRKQYALEDATRNDKIDPLFGR